MARKKLPADITDVQEIMGSICDKWALLILHQLSHGPKRHGELHRGIRGISQKMLTQTLRKLERDRLVQRTVHPVVPPRVDYALTRLGGSFTRPVTRALSMDRGAPQGDSSRAARRATAHLQRLAERFPSRRFRGSTTPFEILGAAGGVAALVSASEPP